MIIIDTQFYISYLQIKSLYIYGRYKKIKRGIPQTKWFCRICRGIGCKLCNYSGKMYKNSIEELIAKPALKLAKGENESFHGAGREDIDVKMLGNGRPFVLEIKNPKKRKIDLNILKEMINHKNNKKIKVMKLKFTNKDEIRNMMFLSLIFGLFGTFVVSTLYSYLITRFRRREVAVLKAMGYSKWSVRIVVISEILVVAVTGFAIGLLGIQAFIYLTRTSAYVYNIVISSTALLSFLAVVISCVPGFILITTRILGVRPIEIFRQK